MNSDLNLLAIEAFLVGLSKSPLCGKALVRGSYVNQHYMGAYSRACKDIDLLLIAPYDKNLITQLLVEALENAQFLDGINFKLETLITEEIWQLSISPGLRASVEFLYGSKTSSLQIDVGANDPFIGHPVPFALHNKSNITLNTVPLETSVAWKFHGLFENLNGSWTPKTLWDLFILTKENNLDPNKLRDSIQLAFGSRLDPIEIVKRLFYGEFGSSKGSLSKWEHDILELNRGEHFPLDQVLYAVKAYFKNVLNIDNDATLLTNSEVIQYRIDKLRELASDEALTKLRLVGRKKKVLPFKAYTSIPHLPGSRLGPSERTIDVNQFNMLTQKAVNKQDVVIVQEKLDGSCVCAYKENGKILALGRDGELASESVNSARQLWSEWVEEHQPRFLALLDEGERVCGEWLAMVHGTRYELTHEPFVAFDIFTAQNKAISYTELKQRCEKLCFITPYVIHQGAPITVEQGIALLGNKGFHGAIDEPEGPSRKNKTTSPMELATEYEWRKQMNTTTEAIRKNKQLRVIGFDDAPFSKHLDDKVNISGIICSNTRFEGMVWGELTRDGLDSTDTLVKLVTSSKFYSQLHAVLLDGIAFGGFNIVNLPELSHRTRLPCLAVMRKLPDMESIDNALRNFSDYEQRKQLISLAGKIERCSEFVFQCAGIDADFAAEILARTTDTGKVPEALRLAHLIGSAVKTGESGKRA